MKAISIFASIILVFLFCSSPAIAKKVYRYKDKNGTLRFTDDITVIPEDQRKNIEAFKDPYKTGTQNNEVSERPPEEKKETIKPETEKAGQNSGNEPSTEYERLLEQKQALDREHNELIHTSNLLLKEEMRIKTDEDAAKLKKRVADLNNRIRKFEKKRVDFAKKLKQYESRHGKPSSK